MEPPLGLPVALWVTIPPAFFGLGIGEFSKDLTFFIILKCCFFLVSLVFCLISSPPVEHRA